MPFGVVSGVRRGMGVLDGVHVLQGEGMVWGDDMALPKLSSDFLFFFQMKTTL